jgi:hypothetical protein
MKLQIHRGGKIELLNIKCVEYEVDVLLSVEIDVFVTQMFLDDVYTDY